MPQQLYQLVSILILAALLYFPVNNLIWMMSVRHLQRRTGKELTPQEIAGQRNRARFISIILVLCFSYLFNAALLAKLYG